MTKLAALPAAPVARISDAERDAIRDYIVRTIHDEVSKAVTKAVPESIKAIAAELVKHLEGVLREEMDRVEKAAPPGIASVAIRDGSLFVRFTDGSEHAAGHVAGTNGKDGKDAEPVDRVALVKEVLAMIPVPRDGNDGEKGEPGPAGSVGATGKRGEKGIDGRDGRDGKDGIASLDDLRAEVAKAVEASVGPTVEKQVAEAFAALPTLQYRGVFRDEATYKAGHCVTWAGAVWHANAVTQEKPGEGQTAWTLMVKRGDKGKDLR